MPGHNAHTLGNAVWREWFSASVAGQNCLLSTQKIMPGSTQTCLTRVSGVEPRPLILTSSWRSPDVPDSDQVGDPQTPSEKSCSIFNQSSHLFSFPYILRPKTKAFTLGCTHILVIYLYWFSYYRNNFTCDLDFSKKQNNTSTFKWKLSFQVGTLGVFVLFSSNIANTKNNFVTIPLELLQSWFMNLVRKLAPFYM